MRREATKLLHRRSVNTVRFEGKRVDDPVVSSVSSYLVIYVLLYCFMTLMISVDGFDIETNITAVSACFNNIGPALGAAGPASNYADFSAFSKLVLSVAMLLGRLEIYPIILTLSPATWTKK